MSDGDSVGQRSAQSPTRTLRRTLSRGPSSPTMISKMARKAARDAKKKMPKGCKICKIKVTDLDPAFEDGVTLVVWGEKKHKGRVCKYCRKVHIKKFKKKPLKKLVEEFWQEVVIKLNLKVIPMREL